MGTLIRLFFFFIFIFAICLILIRIFENRLVFFPQKLPPDFSPPAGRGIQPQERFITLDNLKIHALYFVINPDRPTILFFHGNAGNVFDRMEFMQLMQAKLDVNIFAIDYRGYGKSSGSPTENGVYRDAVAAWDYLVDSLKIIPSQIIVWGRSLGGAVTVDLVTKRPARTLILEATFSSAKDMMKEMFGPVPVWLFSGVKFNSAAKISANPVPKLFLHGDTDAVVPFELGRKLYECASGFKKFIKLPGANHNDTFIAGGDLYWHAIADFIRQFNLPARTGPVE